MNKPIFNISAPALEMKAYGLAIFLLLGSLFSVGYAQSASLMLFGGENRDVYLGCLTCSEYASDSVLNEYGSYGSPYAMNSIHNSYGSYGSAYSDLSPCNSYAQNPPIIVDKEGGFYGRLTLNQYHSQANNNADLNQWLEYAVCDD